MVCVLPKKPCAGFGWMLVVTAMIHTGPPPFGYRASTVLRPTGHGFGRSNTICLFFCSQARRKPFASCDQDLDRREFRAPKCTACLDMVFYPTCQLVFNTHTHTHTHTYIYSLFIIVGNSLFPLYILLYLFYPKREVHVVREGK
jgi:hypothetical protein